MEFRHKDTAGVDTETLNEYAAQLAPYRTHLHEVISEAEYESPESSLSLPDDRELREKVSELVREKTSARLRYIVVVGVGGSNLGTKAIYESILGHFDELEPARIPKMLFADTTDSEYLTRLITFLCDYVTNPEEVLVVSASKSGTTTESIANTEIILSELIRRFGTRNAYDRLICVTDEGSPLWEKAEEKQISHISVPEQVGGRFSVLSAVGLVPLAALGLDITALHEGAREMRGRCLAESDNPALASAAMLVHHYRSGRPIHDTFIFEPSLESLGKWYRQLIGESIGKECDRDGNEVHVGITPTISIGSTDLHSVGQLYLGGPRDKTTTFISVNTETPDVRIPEERAFDGLVSAIDGKGTRGILQAIQEGTQRAYKKAGIPYSTVLFDSISEYELGAFMQFKMIEIMYVGALLNVNTFNQPNVELYKNEVRDLLK